MPIPDDLKYAPEILTDPQYWKDIGSGVKDVLGRGVVAGTFGIPVDLGSMALRPFTNVSETPVGGSEWIGEKMQKAGLISSTRRPIGELMASLIDPATIGAGVAKVAAMGSAKLGGVAGMAGHIIYHGKPINLPNGGGKELTLYPVKDYAPAYKGSVAIETKLSPEDVRHADLLISALNKKDLGIPYERWNPHEQKAYYDSPYSLDDDIKAPVDVTNRAQRKTAEWRNSRQSAENTPIISQAESGLNDNDYRAQLKRAQKYMNDPEFKARADGFGSVPILVRKEVARNVPSDSASILEGIANGSIGIDKLTGK